MCFTNNLVTECILKSLIAILIQMLQKSDLPTILLPRANRGDAVDMMKIEE
jgi:hypothetical protein